MTAVCGSLVVCEHGWRLTTSARAFRTPPKNMMTASRAGWEHGGVSPLGQSPLAAPRETTGAVPEMFLSFHLVHFSPKMGWSPGAVGTPPPAECRRAGQALSKNKRRGRV